QAGTVAKAEAALAVVGGEIVALVAHRGGQLAVLAQLQRAAGAGGVAGGGGLALAAAAAGVGGLGVFGAGAQAVQVHAVHPVVVGVAQLQAAVETLGGAVAVGGREAELAAAAAPGRGHGGGIGSVVGPRRRGAQQQRQEQG